MSSNTFVPKRELNTLIRGAGAALSGRSRGRDQVRRHSYDVDDKRADVFRRIADGTKKGGGRWRAALLKAAKEFDQHAKEAGKRGPLTPYGIRVLEELLWRALDFKTGRSEPTIAALQGWTGYARVTVVRALARLKAHGFLDWVRRSRRKEQPREYGPQREQTSNAYFFDLGRMAKNVRQRVLDLIARCARGDEAECGTPIPPPTEPDTPAIQDPELAAMLARMAARAEGASS